MVAGIEPPELFHSPSERSQTDVLFYGAAWANRSDLRTPSGTPLSFAFRSAGWNRFWPNLCHAYLKVRSPPPLLFFEQQTRDAEQALIDAKRAAKEAAAKARADAKEKEEREKSTRRLMRAEAYRRKHPPGFAQCGINWQSAGPG